MARIVFASDSHLNKHYGRMTPDQLAERRRRLRAALRATMDHARRERADLYLHGGDLFDGPNPRAVELVWTAGQFHRLHEAGVTCLLIGGNHDVPKTRHGGATPQRLFEEVGVARVFTNPTRVTWWTGEVDGLRLAIGGLPPDPRLEPGDDPLDALQEEIVPPEADAVLLLTHYALEGRLHPLAEEPILRKASVAALAGRVDLILVGHVHEAAELDVAGVRVLFPGPTERLSFGELDVECGFAQIDIQKGPDGRAAIELQRVPLEPQPMRRETIRATDVPAEDPTGWLLDRIRAMSSPEQLLQVRLEGPLPREVYHALRSREAWALGQDLNFYFDLDRRGLSVRSEALPAAAAGQRVSARGELRRLAGALRERAEDEAERALLDRALALALERYGTPELEEAGA